MMKRVMEVVKGMVPIDTDFFLILSDSDRKKQVHISNIGYEEAIEWLDETADFIHKEAKKEARQRKRRL